MVRTFKVTTVHNVLHESTVREFATAAFTSMTKLAMQGGPLPSVTIYDDGKETMKLTAQFGGMCMVDRPDSMPVQMKMVDAIKFITGGESYEAFPDDEDSRRYTFQKRR